MNLSTLNSMLEEFWNLSRGIILMIIYSVMHQILKFIIQSVCRFIISIWDALVNLYHIKMAKNTAKIQSTAIKTKLKQKSFTKYEWMLMSHIHNEVEQVEHKCVFTEKRLRIKKDFFQTIIIPALMKQTQRGFLFDRRFECFNCIRFNLKKQYRELVNQENSIHFFLTLSKEFEYERWNEEWYELAKAIFSIAKKFEPCIIFIDEIVI
ncbi:hypothetical protein FWK35_00033032 [Aphis craccivora]|uniref:Uncharacterized protein n=1 Tax=Aphis craccivora TaxID=307492 RepID=A0A6G0VU37_APHCR|nr:hypothetical protein FWK35_00033032 [Aphis craccivora]